MVRQARIRCDSGLYHIVLRGINRQPIFYEEYDFKRFLETLSDKKSEQQYFVYAYCLMNNHVHLLIQENVDAISRIMSRIGTSYAWWYNQKYERSGHVFQGRYGSECVENDAYLLTVMRYIHNNPVKAGIVNLAEDYRWSSIHAYYHGREHPKELTDTSFILNMLNQDRAKAISELREFMNRENEDKCMENNVKRKSDGEVIAEIEAIMNGQLISTLQGLAKEKRRDILRMIKESEGVSYRQIARVTGLNPNIVFKA